jgi:hypothetical protein
VDAQIYSPHLVSSTTAILDIYLKSLLRRFSLVSLAVEEVEDSVRDQSSIRDLQVNIGLGINIELGIDLPAVRT